MNDINTVEAEKSNLELHVDLCAQRYLLLEKRLGIVEAKVDALSQAIAKGQRSISTVVISSAATVTASVMGLIATILLKF